MRARTATALPVLIALAAEEAAPEWIHLVPKGEVMTVDGRGPYWLKDAAEAARLSLEHADRLPIDENHAIDLAAPKGGPSPARGWIVELQGREDGLWGRVEWTEEGRRLVAGGAYRHISPAIRYLPDGLVVGVVRASLTNRPNLRGLTALHQEDNMDLLADLREALGLKEDADADAAIAAVKELKGGASKEALALQQLGGIAKAVGLAEDATGEAILGAVKTLADPTESPTVVALQQELATVVGELKELKGAQARERSAAVIDQAIADRKAGVNQTNRDQLIALHMEKPAEIDAWLDSLPSLGTGPNPKPVPPKDKDGNRGLDEAQTQAVALMGIDPEAYRKTLAAEAAQREEAL